MTDQTEREALVQAIASSLAMSYGSHVNAPKGGRDWKAAEDLLGVLEHLGLHRPTPRTVTTEQVQAWMNESWSDEEEHGESAAYIAEKLSATVLDAVTTDAPMTVETVEGLTALPVGTVVMDGDACVFVKRELENGTVRWESDGKACIQPEILEFGPVTVLAPAIDRDDEALVERVAEAIAAEYDRRGHLKPGAYWSREHRRISLRADARAALKAVTQ